MAYQTGTVTGHKTLLATIKTFLEGTPGWVSQRSVTGSGDNEEIWRLPGLSGTDYSYVGIKTYDSAPGDYYNWKINGFTGYVSGNTFEMQPGRCTNGPTGAPIDGLGIPLYSNSLEYWIEANAQHMNIFVKVGSIYVWGYGGKYFPNGSPNQNPYPLFIGGMFTGPDASKYSVTSTSGWKGARVNGQMRDTAGQWRNPQILPYSGPGIKYLRNTGTDSNLAPGYYSLKSLKLSENTFGYVNNYGWLDGIFFISGYQNGPENTLTISGTDYIVFPDYNRNDKRDYIAMKKA